MITLYKRNAKGDPIFWSVHINPLGGLTVNHGIVGKHGHEETITTNKKESDEMSSMIKKKRKEGYKRIEDLYDNAPSEDAFKAKEDLIAYLNNYLPKYNTHDDGNFIPMLCKTLEDNTPFEKGTYFGQYKINGERCIITATKEDDLFGNVKLHFRSREGVDWTDKLEYMSEFILPILQGFRASKILELMIEEGVGLDGELYIPGYSINEINSFIKNTELPQHFKLQYWCYDLCMENTTARYRQIILHDGFAPYLPIILNKNDHLNNTKPFVCLNHFGCCDITDALVLRDRFIALGFEGLVIREQDATYQFGGKRNNAMLKFKKKLDGYFKVVDIKEDKRGLPVFTLKNDLNDELFDATINIPQNRQRVYLDVKDSVIAHGTALVEYRERSGVKQVPFHAKIIKIIL